MIFLFRSNYTLTSIPRQQVNQITSYIDASNVYGSNLARANELRTLDGTGRLKTSAGDFLPFNVNNFSNAPSPSSIFFLAGDVRANEQVGLTAMHTLFVREHNRWAKKFKSVYKHLGGEEIYQRARMIVSAEIQAISYRDFIPVLLGPDALDPYTGYDDGVNAGIANIFSTSAYRLGHSMLSSTLLRLKKNGDPISEGNLALKDAFFDPNTFLESGVEPILRGLIAQTAQDVDVFVIDAVRNFLFGPPGAGGFDLPALNIQRGRDHGLPSYNQARIDFGLAPAASFADVSSDATVVARLTAAYLTVDDIDVWVGGLAEDHVNGGLMGELFFTILKDQFERLRDGDRFWYEQEDYLPQNFKSWVDSQTLTKIIRRNTAIGGDIPNDAFHVQ